MLWLLKQVDINSRILQNVSFSGLLIDDITTYKNLLNVEYKIFFSLFSNCENCSNDTVRLPATLAWF